ncbi:MAG: hypothetical protein V1800_16585 [Candidatus Latescibacterota bacterium]
MFFGLCVYASLTNGNTAMAANFLSKMKSSIGENSHALWRYQAAALWLDLRRGELQIAAARAEAALTLAAKAGMLCPQAAIRIVMAQILCEMKEIGEAESHLSLARAPVYQSKSLALEYMFLLVQAQVALSRGEGAAGLDCLRQAMALGRKQGCVDMPWWWPEVVTRLCLKALDAGIDVPYVQDLVRKRGLFPKSAPVEVAAWPWALEVYTLGLGLQSQVYGIAAV